MLNGAEPADLPTEQPTRFEIVVHLKTAKTLDITNPRSILVKFQLKYVNSHRNSSHDKRLNGESDVLIGEGSFENTSCTKTPRQN